MIFTLPANLALWMPCSTGGTKLSTGTMTALVSGLETSAALTDVASLSMLAVVNSVSATPQLGQRDLNFATPWAPASVVVVESMRRSQRTLVDGPPWATAASDMALCSAKTRGVLS